MRVGAADLYAQRYAVPIGQERSFDAEFATIGRVFPGFFPRPVATWSSPRPYFASPIGSPSARRIPEGLPSTVCGTRPIPSTPESNCAACCQCFVSTDLAQKVALAKQRFPRW
jgi:hypothetical protein